MRWLSLALVLTGWLAAGAAPTGETRIMYFSPQAEIKLSVAFKRLHPELPVLCVGVRDTPSGQLGMVRFLAVKANRAQVRREAVRLTRTAFQVLPNLTQLDLTGDDRDEYDGQKKRPKVLFSASVRRGWLAGISPEWPPGRQLQATGEVFYSPDLPEVDEPEARLASLLREQFQSGFGRVPVVRATPVRRSSAPRH